jgi:starch phosphorylase
MNPEAALHALPAAVDEPPAEHGGRGARQASATDLMHAVAQVAREQLSRRWVASDAPTATSKARRVYYLSMEFLIGRTLGNALAALDLQTASAAQAARPHARHAGGPGGTSEPDAALGNGGLGRLAACFLDSMATLGLPSFGYGIRYEFGMFAQSIQGGRQVEHPDPWLEDGTPWEFPRRAFTTRCASAAGSSPSLPGKAAGLAPAGRSQRQGLRHGDPRPRHRPRQHLRLWKAAAPARSTCGLQQRRLRARGRVQEPVREHLLGAVPERQHPGRPRAAPAPGVLLHQRVIQDILARHLAEHGGAGQPGRQGGHPPQRHAPGHRRGRTDAAAVDEHGLPWSQAWAITQKVFSYTNHTLMPEALETWPVALMQHVLPRHLEIIFRINHDFLVEAARTGRATTASCAACR